MLSAYVLRAQQILAGIVALEAQRELLGDAVVDDLLAALRSRLVDLTPAEPPTLPRPCDKSASSSSTWSARRRFRNTWIQRKSTP